ncbi:MAG: three-Cys-motif partner protein TcmP [Candidatus Didemnitutus sp.]|nr:three-Cys-motif partner protein TcmP [Candidatus Didemnitutus sp.]
MSNTGFHEKPYDAGSLTKLKIFELYVQEWIPVFLSRPDPPFREIHLFDLFCGPGTDSVGQHGSPLRILSQLRAYERESLAGWSRVDIVVHFSDADADKVLQLRELVTRPEWQIPGIKPQVEQLTFEEALVKHHPVLTNPRIAKLLILDQFGVHAITEAVFRQLISAPRTDFIFFLSSSTLNRFREHPAIKIKIGAVEDSYDVHRVVCDWYLGLTPKSAYLGRFSIKKGSNIYGLIFGSQHPLGAHKFLEVAWKHDEIAGEANFDIDRENIAPGEITMDFVRPQKVQAFEADIETALRAGKIASESELIHFCISAGMTSRHVKPVLQKLKSEGVVQCDFLVPNVRNLSNPRTITVRSQ